jgi:hypothetical protein
MFKDSRLRKPWFKTVSDSKEGVVRRISMPGEIFVNMDIVVR